jgi:hypothetical protein
MGHLLGYARVSTTDQQPHLQVDALQRAGCYRVFTETASGVRVDRPTLEQVLDQLRPGDALASGQGVLGKPPAIQPAGSPRPVRSFCTALFQGRPAGGLLPASSRWSRAGRGSASHPV